MITEETLARALYDRRPAMTRDQLGRRYSLSFEDAKSYGRDEVVSAYADAETVLASLLPPGTFPTDLPDRLRDVIRWIRAKDPLATNYLYISAAIHALESRP